ncbi:SLATT domain-containing protein [Desulfovibrio sp. TomC]|uniref:SLATT domain-containing protein n=1 Tax=Desulfovibrio sp. TomC TaxID=1562888 RepID=UPI0012E20C3E|nr:SLATT domain-containing protein [Desulfovibrio sp. TomC]
MVYDNNHFQHVCKEVKRHLEDSEISKLAHWYAATVYDRRYKICIGLPATFFSIIITWMLSANVQDYFKSNPGQNTYIIQLPLLLSLIVSILSGLGTFLDFRELATKHRTAAENLHSLWRDCKNWETDFPDAEMCEKAVQTIQLYRKRLNEINRDAPQIPKWAWKSVNSQRKEGSINYANE